MNIVTLSADEAEYVLENLASIDRDRVYRLRFAIDNGQIKIKVNEDAWTQGFGKAGNDPFV